MNFYRSVILIGLVLLLALNSKSQDNPYVYRDTAIMYTDSVEAKSFEVSPDDEPADDEADYITDTVLRNNQLMVDPDSIRALKKSKAFLYTRNLDSLLVEYSHNQAINKDSRKPALSWLERFFLSPVTKYFFWILAGFFVSFILYKLFFTEGFFQRTTAKMNVTALPGEPENIFISADYGNLISRAIAGQQYRIAVRYLYLQSLQNLSSKGIIQFAADKTNYQYIREMTGKTFKKTFAALTLHYEYVWYGGFEPDENAFHVIQNKFKQFNSEVKR